MSKFVIALNENNEKVVIITHSNQDFGAEDFKCKLGLKMVLSRGHVNVDEKGKTFIEEFSVDCNEEDAIFIDERFNLNEIKMFNLIRRNGMIDIILTNIKTHRYLQYIKDCHDVNIVSEQNQNNTFGYISGFECQQ